MPTTGVRFALETALIVATAAVTGFAHLGAWAIVGAVVVVWLATSVFEYSRSHPRSAGSGKSSHAIRGPEVEPLFSADDAVERVRVLVGARQASRDESLDESVLEVAPGAPPRFELGSVVQGGVVQGGVVQDGVVQDGAVDGGDAEDSDSEDSDSEDSVEYDNVAEETRVQPSPDSTTVVSVDATVEPTAAERVAMVDGLADEPELAVEPPGAESWPDRASAQGALDANSTSNPESEPVIGAAWSWNVWNLERVVRERAATNEELNFLLLYLRDYANPAGMLPPDFDSLVRESFGDLLAAPS